MTAVRSKSIPLPCALLALSVAVCLGAAGPVDASTLRAAANTQAEQRQSLEHLLEAIQLAAKKLTDRLDGQIAMHERQDAATLATTISEPTSLVSDPLLTVLFLRDALLNLPPPSC